MEIEAIYTEIFYKGMNLVDFILKHAGDKIKENSVLAITSKIVSLSEGRVVSKEKISKKNIKNAEE